MPKISDVCFRTATSLLAAGFLLGVWMSINHDFVADAQAHVGLMG